MVCISSREDLLDYCKEKGIQPNRFNEAVTINSDFVNPYEADDYGIPTMTLFQGFSRFNSKVVISEGVTNCSGLLYEASAFNRKVVIPQSVTNCRYMFGFCEKFNQEVIIPDTVIDCGHMFEGCRELNSSIVIPDSVEYTYYMFSHCFDYNKYTTIPKNIKNCNFMFCYCSSFNQKVNVPYLPDELYRTPGELYSMFEACYALQEENIILPESIDGEDYDEDVFAGCFDKFCDIFDELDSEDFEN